MPCLWFWRSQQRQPKDHACSCHALSRQRSVNRAGLEPRQPQALCAIAFDVHGIGPLDESPHRSDMVPGPGQDIRLMSHLTHSGVCNARMQTSLLKEGAANKSRTAASDVIGKGVPPSHTILGRKIVSSYRAPAAVRVQLWLHFPVLNLLCTPQIPRSDAERQQQMLSKVGSTCLGLLCYPCPPCRDAYAHPSPPELVVADVHA